MKRRHAFLFIKWRKCWREKHTNDAALAPAKRAVECVKKKPSTAVTFIYRSTADGRLKWFEYIQESFLDVERTAVKSAPSNFPLSFLFQSRKLDNSLLLFPLLLLLYWGCVDTNNTSSGSPSCFMYILKWRSWAGGRRQLQKVIVMMTTFPTNFRLSSSSFSSCLSEGKRIDRSKEFWFLSLRAFALIGMSCNRSGGL